ncbi:hypothetical protein F5890DRAFT_1542210 [Lentinula detonsa]|uniref:Uncharacterized protein n=1 Tax=Lentinula detonsa TaxID=2804962 RepID=A0AA38PS63_9AGAR|nr:hypothetical protein F5890DRAFT_1542210 [Lentinula detonsa]
MSKEQRKQVGIKRITAYCIAESLKMKLLASFLKREHNFGPRVFDEALCTIFHCCRAMAQTQIFTPQASAPVNTHDGK